MNNNLLNNKILDIHADDYAYSMNTSLDILNCMKQGSLSSISIICNTSYFDECMQMLYEQIPTLPFLPKLSIHLNIVEGFKISNHRLDLISKECILNKSWAYYYLNSLSFNKDKIKKQVKEEIQAQIDKTKQAIEKCIEIAKTNNIEYNQNKLRIDSHVHTHLIPIVWDSLIEVIKENNYEIEYIRNPKEPLIPFIKKSELLGSYSIVNMIKNRILMLHSNKVDRYCDENNLNKMYMCGLMMSGNMNYDRLKIVFPDLKKICENNNRNLEILFHPGLALKQEETKEMNNEYFSSFNSSVNRKEEYNTVMNFEMISKE